MGSNGAFLDLWAPVARQPRWPCLLQPACARRVVTCCIGIALRRYVWGNWVVKALVLGADAVVFAMPTYWFSAPSNVKAVLDRLYCFLPSGKMGEVAGKRAALVAYFSWRSLFC